MVAIVLAGGLGMRLRSTVPDQPKAMATVAGKPFLEYVLRNLLTQGITHVVLAIGYKGDVIRAHFRDGAEHGLELSYSDDGPELLGTAGAVRRALDHAVARKEEFVLVANGDTYVDFDLQALRLVHRKRQAKLVLVAAAVPDVSRYGSLELASDGAVVAFQEKGLPGPGAISAGVYFTNREVLEGLIPSHRRSSLEASIFPSLAGRSLYAHVTTGHFIDIGVPEEYQRAQTLFARRPFICR